MLNAWFARSRAVLVSSLALLSGISLIAGEAQPAAAAKPEAVAKPIADAPGKPAAAEAKPWYADWFEPELAPEAMVGWKAETLELGWSQARVYRHQPDAGVKANPKTIVAILPKDSISYPKAFSRLLMYIGPRFGGSSIVLCNFNKDEANFPKILQMARERKADLFFTIGSESATAAANHYIGCGIPVVTCNNKDPQLMGLLKDPEKGSGNNIAFTTVNMTADSMLVWILKFRPNLKRVAIIYDKKHKEVNAAEVTPLRELFVKKGIEVLEVGTRGPKTAMEDLPVLMPQALEQMKAKDPKLADSIFLVTSCNSIWEQPGMQLVAKLAGDCPVLSTVTDAVTGGDDGALIGIGLDRGTAAHLAAVYAGRILSGKQQPQTMPLGRVSPPDIAISFNKARQIGVSIPFEFFENASFVYGYEGKRVQPAGAGSGTSKN